MQQNLLNLLWSMRCFFHPPWLLKLFCPLLHFPVACQCLYKLQAPTSLLCLSGYTSFPRQAIPVTFYPWAASVRKRNHPFWGGFCPIQSCFLQEYYMEPENKVYMLLSKTFRKFFFLYNLPYYFQSFCQCGHLAASNLCSTMFWVRSLCSS